MARLDEQYPRLRTKLGAVTVRCRGRVRQKVAGVQRGAYTIDLHIDRPDEYIERFEAIVLPWFDGVNIQRVNALWRRPTV